MNKMSFPSTKTPTRVSIHHDGSGNKIFIEHYDSLSIIKLQLASETRKRNIGTIDLENRKFFITRKKDKHLFIKLNAYGFNHHIIKEAKLFDTIFLSDEHNTWTIPRDLILSKGKFLNFNNHGGFELQIFVSLSDIEQYKN